jgi:hypothetical protein
METLVVDNGPPTAVWIWNPSFQGRVSSHPAQLRSHQSHDPRLAVRTGDYVFFLHEDTEVSPDTVRQLAAKLDADSEVTAVAPMLVTANGNPAPQVGHLPPDGTWRPVFDSSQVGMPENPAPVPVDYARGAALMIRKFFLSAMREIDERYGQYGSDATCVSRSAAPGRKFSSFPTCAPCITAAPIQR